jgi:polysaccharide pyruvyl transferase WcaK-like protein
MEIPPKPQMRIVIEPSGYDQLRNLGDVAMQQTALSRVAKFWPSADIQVLTDFPEALTPYAPNVRGLWSMGRRAWMSGLFLPPHEYIDIPRIFRQWDSRVRRAHPGLTELLTSFKLKLVSGRYAAALDSFLEAIRTADLLVVCGMGGVTDAFEDYALDLLDTIKLVKANGKGVVTMFGQAFGPIGCGTAVAKRAHEVLPHVDFIALREARTSLPLLKSLGVDLSRVMVTGDDALEVAVQNRGIGLGDSIGINLRIASYSDVTLEHAQQLREVLQCFAELRSAPLQPLPSSSYVEEADSAFIQFVTEGYSRVHSNVIDSPAALATQVRNCRIAIVGSYHAAVFALAQGISIVGLYNSDYYRDKFLGLEALFEVGVSPVNLAEPKWAAELGKQLDDVWESAPLLRSRLIAVVDKQIELGCRAYDHVRELVELRCGNL